jgi:hypothetical protein
MDRFELFDQTDELYDWLLFTIIFGILSMIGAFLFVFSYKIMILLRRRRLEEKAEAEFGLREDFNDVKFKKEPGYAVNEFEIESETEKKKSMKKKKKGFFS